ncbi:MAG: STAS domain-containing protein [Desulfovibrionaceae bacterium]
MSGNGEGERRVLAAGRSIGAAEVEDLRGRLKALVDGGARHLVLDMDAVEILDSMGIGLLVAAHNTLRGVGGVFEVVNASPDVFNLLRTMRLDKHFSIGRKA